MIISIGYVWTIVSNNNERENFRFIRIVRSKLLSSLLLFINSGGSLFKHGHVLVQVPHRVSRPRRLLAQQDSRGVKVRPLSRLVRLIQRLLLGFFSSFKFVRVRVAHSELASKGGRECRGVSVENNWRHVQREHWHDLPLLEATRAAYWVLEELLLSCLVSCLLRGPFRYRAVVLICALWVFKDNQRAERGAHVWRSLSVVDRSCEQWDAAVPDGPRKSEPGFDFLFLIKTLVDFCLFFFFIFYFLSNSSLNLNCR